MHWEELGVGLVLRRSKVKGQMVMDTIDFVCFNHELELFTFNLGGVGWPLPG